MTQRCRGLLTAGGGRMLSSLSRRVTPSNDPTPKLRTNTVYFGEQTPQSLQGQPVGLLCGITSQV
ncbi:hypothetical protein CCMA1212_007008 [Trichoderma ghanense]|uniref:Uncharacterized protein n=1 Tax=Trichoderma ghanense TaxID=65468 RepID=A0ABY2H1N7_9HYPO